jgi:transcriptional regulator of acetoin/glycerol metabolism
VILAPGPYIEVTDLPPAVQGSRVKRPLKTPVPFGCTLNDLERLAILQALEITHWNKRATASLLGIPRPTLYNKLRKHRLWRDEDRFRREA